MLPSHHSNACLLYTSHSFGLGHILVLLTLAATVVWVIWGVMTQGYYMPEIATQFFIMGIVSGVIGVRCV